MNRYYIIIYIYIFGMIVVMILYVSSFDYE